MYKNLIPLVAASMALISCNVLAVDGMPNPERQRELARFVHQECGFCHGLRLTGGLGSPLTPEALRNRPAELMVAVILHGIPGTAMPPWQPYLSEPDVRWIVHALQEGQLDAGK